MVVREILYKHLVDDNYKEPYEGEYWPSQLWQCVRRQYYDRVSPIPSGVDTARFTVLGDVIHELVAELLKKENTVRVLSEVPIRIPHPTNHGIVISGRADDLIVVEFTKDRYLVEVKTTDGLRDKVEKGYLPRMDHKAQLNLYLKAYPKAKGIILYIDRSDFDMEEFQMDFDEQLYQKTLERAEMLHKAIEERKLPPAEAKQNKDMSWQCNYCIHKAKCDRDG